MSCLCHSLLNVINAQLGNQGVLQPNCDLLFFTHVLCFKVILANWRGLQLFQWDRLHPDYGWRLVGNTPYAELIPTLQQEQPFLSSTEIPIFWTSFPPCI